MLKLTPLKLALSFERRLTFVFLRYVKEKGCLIEILPQNKRTGTSTKRCRNSK